MPRQKEQPAPTEMPEALATKIAELRAEANKLMQGTPQEQTKAIELFGRIREMEKPYKAKKKWSTQYTHEDNIVPSKMLVDKEQDIGVVSVSRGKLDTLLNDKVVSTLMAVRVGLKRVLEEDERIPQEIENSLVSSLLNRPELTPRKRGALTRRIQEISREIGASSPSGADFDFTFIFDSESEMDEINHLYEALNGERDLDARSVEEALTFCRDCIHNTGKHKRHKVGSVRGGESKYRR